jgi:hypothetical protein
MIKDILKKFKIDPKAIIRAKNKTKKPYTRPESSEKAGEADKAKMDEMDRRDMLKKRAADALKRARSRK